jgi:F-type H+-transporting ATPase subunit b
MPEPIYMLTVLAQNSPTGNEPAGGSGQEVFDFSFGAYAFSIINFLVLVALLYKFLHKPLLNILDKRRERIEGKEQAAERKAQEADAKRREYEDKMAGLQEERDKLLAEARKQADEKRQEMLEEAREAAARHAENMKRDWQRQERDALDRLENEILAASVEMVRRIVNKLTDADFEQRMEDRLLAQLDELAARDDEALREELFDADVPVRVASAREMPDDQREFIRGKIQAIAGEREVQVEFSEDSDLVAGARVEFSSMAVDASLADILEAARARFDAVTDGAESEDGGQSE